MNTDQTILFSRNTVSSDIPGGDVVATGDCNWVWNSVHATAKLRCDWTWLPGRPTNSAVSI